MLKKNALITGASGDIGKSIAFALASEGYDLFLCGNKNKIDVSKITANVEQLYFDQSQPKKVKEVFENLRKKNVKFDLVVCNAGIAEDEKMLIDKEDDEIDLILKTNLNGTIYCNKYAIPLLKRGSSIINIASFLGIYGGSCEATYSASKAGVIGFTKALAKEIAPLGIRVNCISPGFIDTKMNACFNEKEKLNIIEETPLKKMGTCDDVAKAVVFLANSDFVTGENLIISGGLII